MKSIEQIRKEVRDDLVNTCLNDSKFLHDLITGYVEDYTDDQVREMWLDAGLDERENDDD
jgi:hypothetical protein